ncbi:MAG TPA: hypothetical protein PLQ74_06645 [Pseudomonadota bacterium]|nr:hypothetical protein [Rhodanobacteraceae bacterium]MBP9155394.1 hypothetical protein [Xanthomonadales bacterium]HQW81527.1 hypothetical protein [Pseudomonadota bacterium]
MKNLFRIAVLLTLPLFAISACKKEEAAKPAVAVAAPVTMPADPNDTAAWKNYLVGVAKQNMEGIRQRPYFYYLPAGDSPEILEQVDRQISDVTDVVGRGILPGNMIAFGSPDSTRMADGIIEAFKVSRPASLKDVRVLFIGAAADEQRVRDAVTPSAAEFVFVEAK